MIIRLINHITVMNTEENNQNVDVDTTLTNESEATTEDTIAVPKADYEKLNQTLGSLKRELKDLKKSKEEPKEVTKIESKSDELDYGQKAFLRSYDIKGADEINLVKNWQKRTGDELDAIVEDEIFQAKLKSLREVRASNEALPKSNRRGTQPAPNDESYWTSKIESGQATLADIEDIEMRRKVLNKRVAKEKSGNRFSSTPIVMT